MDLNTEWNKIDRDDSVKFYRDYFDDERELTEFLDKVYGMDWDNRIPRRMINQIRRFVTLAVRIEEIYPPRDGLRLVFIRTCMEALSHLDKSVPKKDFFGKFEKCFDEEGAEYIHSHFELAFCEKMGKHMADICGGGLSVKEFFELVRYIRNQAVHDGIFWEIQVFAGDEDTTWSTHFETKENIFESKIENKGKNVVTYHFKTTLQFDRFIYYFTRACVNYVNQYIDRRLLKSSR